MEIKNIKPRPYVQSIYPSIIFEIEISYIVYQEAIIGMNGWLETDDKKIIAEINESTLGNQSVNLGAAGTSFDLQFGEGVHQTKLVAILDKIALEHIERRRMEDRKGDVNLTLNLNVKSVENRARVSHLYEVNPTSIGVRKINISAPGGPFAGSIIAGTYNPNFSADRENRWILSGSSSPIFLSVKNQALRGAETIPSSDWINDYAPKLGLGEYFVVAIPKGEKTIKKAWEYVEKAEEGFRKWVTKEVYANCREAGSLLDKTMKANFATNPVIKKWKKAIENFKSEASLNLHTEEIKEQKPAGEVEVRKADCEHLLIVTKALIKYAEELLQEAV